MRDTWKDLMTKLSPATKLVLTLWRKGREAPLPSACVTYQVRLDTPYRAFTVRVAPVMILYCVDRTFMLYPIIH